MVTQFFLTILTCLSLLTTNPTVNVRGKVTNQSGEPLIGATVQLGGTDFNAVVGLNGKFKISKVPPGKYTFKVRYVGYKNIVKIIDIPNNQPNFSITFKLKQSQYQLDQIVVSGQAKAGSEVEARNIEHEAAITENVVSSFSIKLSPYNNMANVLRSVSGVTIQRDHSGTPEYAILRGMSRRYSYTLINGLKVASPDDKRRYVPLDIFPSSFIEKTEVYKSLQPDMMGDAIGGGVNLTMKNAPPTFTVNANGSVGYNSINLRRDFSSYNTADVNYQSPRQIHGNKYAATPSDFSNGNLILNKKKPIPNLNGNFSIGNRFLKNKLGVLVGASIKNQYRGLNSQFYTSKIGIYGSDKPNLRNFYNRKYSTQKRHTSFHTKIDYRFNNDNKISLYSGYYNLFEAQVRNQRITEVKGRGYNPKKGKAILTFATRTRTTNEHIFDNIFNGTHQLTPRLKFNWKGLVSFANRKRPDKATFRLVSQENNFNIGKKYIDRNQPRRWTHNSDREYSGHGAFTYKPKLFSSSGYIKAGGMYRHRTKDNYENKYTFDPKPNVQQKGKDFTDYSDASFKLLSPQGSASSAVNFRAHANIAAGFLMTHFTVLNTQITGGVRIESTDQGYRIKHPLYDQTPDSTAKYYDILPSVGLKYMLSSNINIRASYYKAIARPGFFEIVPYRIQGNDYYNAGNPSLKHVRANNYDFRFEYFPHVSSQFMAGFFFKKIKDPIEYALLESGVHHDLELKPNNFGTAHNLGFEVDITKYFHSFGIKANYTYTHSKITTSKIIKARKNPNDEHSQLINKKVNQTRPLQGQARNVANFSLLYKNQRSGTNAQLASVFTGQKLVAISPYLNNDIWTRPEIQLSASFEQSIGNHFKIFLKAKNLLNSAYKEVIRKGLLSSNGYEYPYQSNPDNYTLIRRNQFYRRVQVGLHVSF